MGHLILHIDDSEFVLRFVNRGLTHAGFQVASISDLSAVADVLAQQGMPDLILLDINMPEAQGDDLAQFFINKWQLAIPIVLFSDLPREEIAHRAQNAGATTFVKKEEGIPRLIDVLRQHLAARPAPAEPAEAFNPRFAASADGFVKRMRHYLPSLAGDAEGHARGLRNIHRELTTLAREARLRGPAPIANLLAAAERFAHNAQQPTSHPTTTTSDLFLRLVAHLAAAMAGTTSADNPDDLLDRFRHG